jgi:hypothetical protein
MPAHLPRLSTNDDLIARCCRATIVDVIRWGFHLTTGDEKIGDFLDGGLWGSLTVILPLPTEAAKIFHSRLNFSDSAALHSRLFWACRLGILPGYGTTWIWGKRG